MYSGFLNAGPAPGPPHSSMNMHYVFIESERSPSTDPLIVWCRPLPPAHNWDFPFTCRPLFTPFRYNGGPGASSLFGLYVELGPLLLNDLSLAHPLYNSTGVPQLVRNPWGCSTNINTDIRFCLLCHRCATPGAGPPSQTSLSWTTPRRLDSATASRQG
jgi:hypothetical protein